MYITSITHANVSNNTRWYYIPGGWKRSASCKLPLFAVVVPYSRIKLFTRNSYLSLNKCFECLKCPSSKLKIVDTKLNSWRWDCELTFDQYCTCMDWNSYSSTKTCTGIMLTQCDCSRMKLVCQWKWWMQMLWFNLVHGSIFILHPLS